MKKHIHYFLLLLALAAHSTNGIIAQTPEWHYLGDNKVSEGGAESIFLAFQNDTPYAAFESLSGDHAFQFKKFDGTQWTPLDTTGVGGGAVILLELGFDPDGALRFAYFNRETTRFGIKRLGANGWVTLTESPPAKANYLYRNTSAVFDGQTLFVAFADDSIDDRASVWKFDGTGWSSVGQPGISAGWVYPLILQVHDGLPSICYLEYTSKSCIAQRFDGNAWQPYGATVFTSPFQKHYGPDIDFMLIGGTPYVAYRDSTTEHKISVLKFDGGAWVNVGQKLITQPSFVFTLGQDAETQTPYLLFEDYEPNTFWNGLSVLRFEGADWDIVGYRFFAFNSLYLNLKIHDGIPYAAFQEGVFGGDVAVMVYSPVSAAPDPQAQPFSLKILPNPVANGGVLQIEMETEDAFEGHAQILDAAGKMLLRSQVSAPAGKTTQQILPGNLPAGVYHLRLQAKNGRGLAMQSFVVQN